jgi:hypothetical protein
MQTYGIEGDQLSLKRPEWTFQAAATSRVADRIAAMGRPLNDIVDGRIFYGVKTGYNEAFVINEAKKLTLINDDAASADLIKPLLAGQDLRPWYHEYPDRFLIFTRQGTDIEKYPAIKEYLEKFRTRLEPQPRTWNTAEKWEGRKPGDYRWFELQDTVDYYREFEKHKIVWPDIAKLPRFSWDETGSYLGNTGYIITGAEPSLLAVLQSRAVWFAISQIAQPLRERAGLWQYWLIRQFIDRVPIPNIPAVDGDVLGALASKTTVAAKERYELHRSTRARIATDLGRPGIRLNQKLSEWWNLDFPRFRVEVEKHLKQDIPVRERDEWDAWLEERQRRHAELTEAIISAEKDINQLVYTLFDLSRSDIEVIEKSTKYSYGEV